MRLVVGTMDRGKEVVDGGVSVEVWNQRPHSTSFERDEEDEDVESEVEPKEDPEEKPEEDPDEELEEDPEEEPEGNHVEYHVEQRYETFHMPYVEYTPTSLGTYWE
ncbi:unnamed protein product [Lactuca saligna]|uniref:Uncharacterized protein n=1 Tax=Lactuca saligna TaxID=75948 RepID=A0AA35UYJ7_LACSI|nr:unnamed protein product [Lactuca saligna]